MVKIPTFKTLSYLLILIITAHNFEEWLTFPHFGELSEVIGRKFGMHAAPKPWPVVQGGLIFVTVVPALIIVLAKQTGKSWGPWLICWMAAIYLANVFVPHIPAMIMLGGYAPGGFTALLLNLPLTVLVLRQARREQLLSRNEIAITVVAGVLSLPFAITLAFAVAGMIVA
jgi:Protein of unknown function with HXXEE motif